MGLNSFSRSEAIPPTGRRYDGVERSGLTTSTKFSNFPTVSTFEIARTDSNSRSLLNARPNLISFRAPFPMILSRIFLVYSCARTLVVNIIRVLAILQEISHIRARSNAEPNSYLY